ncbi:response regulator [Comamonas antarctica]|uniref:Response regulator n=1 Tax=Comamonas antarctica TaxID=2743470 RepID=A0A6N1X8K9_9BURK|nr:response regulator [Comamonas antarctica]QKV54673.1 response regulator [Comamonas antarctica]
MQSIERILIVDDDPEIRGLLCEYLAAAGYRIAAAANGTEMQQQLAQHAISLVVLDVMMPGTDGLTLCRNLSARGGPPVILLTARGALLDRIVGLEMGADDYLPKPFDPRELLARIKVVLRRTHSFPPAREAEAAPVVHFCGWQLNTRQRQLLSPQKIVIALGDSDYQVLRLLLQNPHRTLSRDFLIEQVFGKERAPTDRAIDVCISRLRMALQEDARRPALIRTVRHAGYVLTADVQEGAHGHAAA